MNTSTQASPSDGRDSTETIDHSDPNLAVASSVPSTSLPFSSSSTASLHQPLSSSSPSPPSSIPSRSSPWFSLYFSIASTAAFITSHNARHVALQFPDSLLPLSSHLLHLLSAFLPSPAPSLYVLADTSYASCCVDVTAAQHCGADVIVHYGLACLSTAYRLPVYYVYGRGEMDVADLCERLAGEGWEGEEGAGRRDVLVLCDLEYEWRMHELQEWVTRGAEERRTQRTIVVATVRPPPSIPAKAAEREVEAREHEAVEGQPEAATLHSIAGHAFALPPSASLETFCLLFVGAPSSPALTNAMLTYNALPAYVYDPSSPSSSIVPSSSSASIRRTLSRRYYLTQRAMSASIVGLLVAALSHAAVLRTLERLKALVKDAGKKSYVVAVGKVNPSKLANFAEVDLWVLVSCPFAALLPDAGYFRDVVTPMELEMALKGRPWTGRYSTDIGRLGEADEEQGTGEGEGEGEDGVVFDSATGKLRATLPTFARGGTEVVRREGGDVVKSAADAMRERSWKGLETERERRLRMEREAEEEAEMFGQAKPDATTVSARISVSAVEPGLEGIASRYTKETIR